MSFTAAAPGTLRRLRRLATPDMALTNTIQQLPRRLASRLVVGGRQHGLTEVVVTDTHKRRSGAARLQRRQQRAPAAAGRARAGSSQAC